MNNPHDHNSRYRESNRLLQRAEAVIPLGAQTFSKSRIQFPVPHAPLFLERGKGATVWDVDGNAYIDCIAALLPIVLGYGDPDVDRAIRDQLERGISFSLSTPLEITLAEKLVSLIPCAQMVRFGKNGTDATSAAVRLARAFTGRDLVLALGYHGWQDWFVGATVRHEGVPQPIRELTRRLPFNDIDALGNATKDLKDRVAAVILEPMTSETPREGYLQAVRELTAKHGIVLVYDEIITGFRFALGGAQEYFGVTPDLACFGKAMANGMPLSAVVGRADIMRKMEDVFYSGTFGGETLSLAASIATIDKLERCHVIAGLWSRGEALRGFLAGAIDETGLSDAIKIAGSPPWTIFQFVSQADADQDEIKTYFMKAMLERGILINASVNLTHAHGDDEIAAIVRAFKETCHDMRRALDRKSLRDDLDCAAVRPVFRLRS